MMSFMPGWLEWPVMFLLAVVVMLTSSIPFTLFRLLGTYMSALLRVGCVWSLRVALSTSWW